MHIKLKLHWLEVFYIVKSDFKSMNLINFWYGICRPFSRNYLAKINLVYIKRKVIGILVQLNVISLWKADVQNNHMPLNVWFEMVEGQSFSNLNLNFYIYGNIRILFNKFGLTLISKNIKLGKYIFLKMCCALFLIHDKEILQDFSEQESYLHILTSIMIIIKTYLRKLCEIISHKVRYLCIKLRIVILLEVLLSKVVTFAAASYRC